MTAPPATAGRSRLAGWRPRARLGAPAPGGLALPAARPTASFLYAPRGVWLGEDLLVAADSGNHRILLWHGRPERDGTPADVVLGQPDAVSEGPAAGGRGPARGLHLPTGVLVTEGRLVVADAWHHRVLVWDRVPETPDIAPDLVLGQRDAVSVEANRGGGCGPTTFYWPFGVALAGGRFYVADTGNRRVLGWSGGLPSSPDTPADLVLGQPDPAGRADNRGGTPGPASFRWPHDVTGSASTLIVADAGNHRLLGWSPHPTTDGDASLVLGQPDAVTCGESPYAAGRADRLRFPYAADWEDGLLAVADTADNRVLLWDGLLADGWNAPDAPDAPAGGAPAPGDVAERGSAPPAGAVLGQPTFAEIGENRWTAVGPDTFCWPYGLSLRGERLAVADSGNNRIMIWERHP